MRAQIVCSFVRYFARSLGSCSGCMCSFFFLSSPLICACFLRDVSCFHRHRAGLNLMEIEKRVAFFFVVFYNSTPALELRQKQNQTTTKQQREKENEKRAVLLACIEVE